MSVNIPRSRSAAVVLLSVTIISTTIFYLRCPRSLSLTLVHLHHYSASRAALKAHLVAIRVTSRLRASLILTHKVALSLMISAHYLHST
jgi:hypothetical protein